LYDKNKGGAYMSTQTKQPKTQKRKAQSSTKQSSGDPSSTQQSVKQEDKHRLIAEAAYYIAERRGFQGDMVLEDWLQAEKEVNAQSASQH
jgi:hypothetical protein